MYEGASLDCWETPLSVEGYKWFSISEGAWHSGRFLIPIDCKRSPTDDWERWLCSIDHPIWVRVIMDDLYDVLVIPKLPDGPSCAPCFRVSGSKQKSFYEDWLKTTGTLKAGQMVQEFLIGSLDNEVHILAMQEPSFTRLES